MLYLLELRKYLLQEQEHLERLTVQRAMNALIIPRTVPIRPINTEIEAIVEKITMFFESIGSQEQWLLQKISE